MTRLPRFLVFALPTPFLPLLLTGGTQVDLSTLNLNVSTVVRGRYGRRTVSGW